VFNKSVRHHQKSQTRGRQPGNAHPALTPMNGLIKEILLPPPTEEPVPKSELDFNLLLNNIPAVVFKGYVDGSVDFFDQKIEKMTGYPRMDFETRQLKWTEMILEEDFPQAKQDFIQALKTDKAYVREYRINTRQGEILWIQERSQIVCDQGGEVRYVSGIFFDITARKQAAEALQEGERFLSSVFASIMDGFNVQNLDFTILQVNPTMEQWFSHNLPLVGRKCYEVYHGRSQPCQTCPTYRAILTGEAQRETVSIKGGDGQHLAWLDVHAFPWLDNTSGKMKGVIKYVRDISYRVEAEKTIEESLKNLQKALNGTVKALANTVETKDPYTAGHQRRVVQLACAIAQEMEQSSSFIEGMRVMGFLHDLGKIAIPGEILSKPSKLSNHEFNLIKIHPQTGYNILKDIDFPWPVALAVVQHHERLDGSGYPHGLTDPDIILEARILAVADVIEAIASHRPYRPALGIDYAMAEISENQGKLYDPEVVRACLRLIKEKGFRFH
jgi:PAS domain S-box-containing protein